MRHEESHAFTLLLAVPAGPARQAAARAQWPELVPLVEAAVAKPSRAAKIPAGRLQAAYCMVDAATATRFAHADRRVAAADALDWLERQQHPTGELPLFDIADGLLDAQAVLDHPGDQLGRRRRGLARAAAEIVRLLAMDPSLQPAPSALTVLDAVLGDAGAPTYPYPEGWLVRLALRRPDVLASLAPVGRAGTMALFDLEASVPTVVTILDALARPLDPGVDPSQWLAALERSCRVVTPAILLTLDRIAGDAAAGFLTSAGARLTYQQITTVLPVFDELRSPELRAWLAEAFCTAAAGTLRTPASYELAVRHLPFDRLVSLLDGDALGCWLRDAAPASRRAWMRTVTPDTAASALTQTVGPLRRELLDELYDELGEVLAAMDPTPPALLEPIMARVARELGTEPAAWSLFLQLAPSWTGSAAALVATIRATVE